MLCCVFCFVFSHLNISNILWSFGKCSASTATKHYHSRTVFRESDHPGIVFPGNVLSGKKTIRETSFRETPFRGKTVRESNHPGNDCIPFSQPFCHWQQCNTYGQLYVITICTWNVCPGHWQALKLSSWCKHVELVFNNFRLEKSFIFRCAAASGLQCARTAT